MAIKLCEQTISTDKMTRVYMRLHLDNHRTEEIDVVIDENNEYHYHTSADNNPDLPKPEIREQIIKAFHELW